MKQHRPLHGVARDEKVSVSLARVEDAPTCCGNHDSPTVTVANCRLLSPAATRLQHRGETFHSDLQDLRELVTCNNSLTVLLLTEHGAAARTRGSLQWDTCNKVQLHTDFLSVSSLVRVSDRCLTRKFLHFACSLASGTLASPHRTRNLEIVWVDSR